MGVEIDEPIMRNTGSHEQVTPPLPHSRYLLGGERNCVQSTYANFFVTQVCACDLKTKILFIYFLFHVGVNFILLLKF